MHRSSGSHFSENAERIQLSVDIPGVKAKELTIKVENGILTIAGCRKITLESGGYKKFRFEKNFSIDADSIDVAHLEANLTNGVLILKAPKRKRCGPHYVTVTEGTSENSDDDDDDERKKSNKTQMILLKRKKIPSCQR